ncbi:MAG TPA: hypothetical protein VIC34_03570 [Croceibacterium sp.]|jgi:hypothetical protein
MAQAVLRIEGLPEGALDAAAHFHRQWLPKARSLLDLPAVKEDLVLVFPSATYDHRGWRLAAVQDLAREAAPIRINAIVGDDDKAIIESIQWLARSPGITGQLLAVSAACQN